MEYKAEKETQDFNTKYNISYVDENLSPANNRQIINHYVCSILIYGAALLIINLNPFFTSTTNSHAKMFFYLIYLNYIFVSPIIYFFYRPKSLWKSHNIEICSYIKRVFNNLISIKKPSESKTENIFRIFKPSYEEKQSLMLIFIKVFFGVIMISGLFQNIGVLSEKLNDFTKLIQLLVQGAVHLDFDTIKNTLASYKTFLYTNAIIIIFTIDLLIFSFGYLTELSFLKNKIRSVETTAAGIFFCLICYPPFSSAANAFLGSNQNDYIAAFSDDNSPVTWFFRVCAIFFLIIYVLASAALGTKASNLTNRGTVCSFPYNIVRHPAYISKNIFWFLTTIPMFVVHIDTIKADPQSYFLKLTLVLISIAAIGTIYYFRALTEERHLLKDPDYRKYARKVKYRFIPGLF